MEKLMRKRILSAFSALTVICTLMFTGCGTGIKTIDDNYRNYYQIFVGSFYDSNGDGTGDIPGITEKLDYIKELGCNGIWLTPIMPSPTYHKYDVTDYYAVDESFGTIEDFDELTSKAHEKGIRVIIDLVINHTSSKHPWFLSAAASLADIDPNESLSDEENLYCHYYHFSNEKKDSTYYEVPGAKGWYYEGSFWSEMPDLNFKDEQAHDWLMSEIHDVCDFWMEHGADGFRMDAAMHYEESETELNKEVLSDIYDYCKQKNPDIYMVSEVWGAETAIADYYGSMTPSMFNFPAASAEGVLEKAARGNVKAAKLLEKVKDYQDSYSAANPDFINAWFLTNHDMVRVANNLNSNPDDMRFAGGLLMTMPGSVFIYYGEEIGMKSKGNSDENKRLPFVWSEDKDAEGTCKKPYNADDVEQTFGSLELQKKDNDSIYSYYVRALRMRNENPSIARGSFEICEALSNDDIAAAVRVYGEEERLVVYNTAAEPLSLDLSEGGFGDARVVYSLTLDGSNISKNGNEITMPGKGICVLAI